MIDFSILFNVQIEPIGASEAPQPKVIEIEPVAWMEEELEQNGLVIAVPRTASVASAQLQ